MPTSATKSLSTIHLALALSCATTASIGEAEEWHLELDPAATTIAFELGATLHTVHGTARLGEGRVDFDLESGTAAGRIAVTATSLGTENDGRDKKMHGKVLESAIYPEIVFAPLSVSVPRR